jgi:hypothetical protein
MRRLSLLPPGLADPSKLDLPAANLPSIISGTNTVSESISTYELTPEVTGWARTVRQSQMGLNWKF